MGLFQTIKAVAMVVNAVVGAYWMAVDALKKYNQHKYKVYYGEVA